MFAIEIEKVFSATHQLRLNDGSYEPLHGHDWHVIVTVEAAELDAMGTVMDFHDLERRLEKILSPWNGQRLNDLPPFDAPDFSPSAERVAWDVARRVMTGLPKAVRLSVVRVSEAPGCWALWRA